MSRYIIIPPDKPLHFPSTRKKTTERFNEYRAVKEYGLHTVAPSPNHFQMDIAFFKSRAQTLSAYEIAHKKTSEEEKEFGLSYLILIGVNNRFAIVVPMNSLNFYGVYIVGAKKKDKASIQIALDKALGELHYIAPNTKGKTLYIDCDGEAGFQSLSEEWLEERNISLQSVPDITHTRLGLINRFIRTIRHYGRIAFDTEYIIPDYMELIVRKYNTDAHTTLSRIMGFNVSPLRALQDEELEAFIARKNMAFNYHRTAVRELPIGTHVNAFLHTSFGTKKFDEINDAVIVEKKNNNYVIQKNERRFLVPRFLLVPSA
jgi:hypothetical protein